MMSKALDISTRTMELFRQWGIAAAVEAAELWRPLFILDLRVRLVRRLGSADNVCHIYIVGELVERLDLHRDSFRH